MVSRIVDRFRKPSTPEAESLASLAVKAENRRVLQLVIDYQEAYKVNNTAKTKEVLTEIYELYADRIYTYFYYRTGANQQIAEDLTSRIFEKVINKLHKFNVRESPFAAWLFTVAHNMLSNWYRDKKRKQKHIIEQTSEPLDTPVDETPQNETWESLDRSPEEAALLAVDTEALIQAIGRLPDDRQQVVLLKFSEGLSNAEIGVIMHRSEGAIKSLYHRTLLALREDLEKHGFSL